MCATNNTDPADKMRAIKARSERFRSAASSLSDDLQTLEIWLANLPGKVEAEVWEDLPNGRSDLAAHIGLRFARAGASWHLFVCLVPDAVATESWNHLSSSNIETKIDAAKLVPELLTEILEQHEMREHQAINASRSIGSLLDAITDERA